MKTDLRNKKKKWKNPLNKVRILSTYSPPVILSDAATIFASAGAESIK